MLSKSESNNSQKPSLTEPEEPKVKREAPRDDSLDNSIKTGTSTLTHLFYEILIFYSFYF